MLNGRVAVFISCSERFKERVARPVRVALAERDVHGIIVSDEPLLPGASGDPESKVDTYLDASDAFVALATPDNQLDDGTVETRPNIIDEHARARSRPKLRQRIQVFKASQVRLPSNVNPTYEELDIDNVSPIPELILRQLDSWGVLDAQPRPAATATPAAPATVAELIRDLELGDHEEAMRRAYELVRSESRATTLATVEEFRQFFRVTNEADNHETVLAGSVLEALHKLDPSLISVELIEELAASEDFSVRSTAAILLWDRAEIASGDVPLGVLGRLALPADEDWYVQAPAMAAVKLLLLRRRSARAIFDKLAGSDDPVDRFAVAEALLDLARIDPLAAPRDLAMKVAADPDEEVAAKGREALAAIPETGENERDPISPFGL
jgi:hypothetical protein